jgi:PEGA domain
MRNKALVFFVLIGAVCFAADTVLVWPSDGQAQLKFSVGKLNQIKAYSGQADYVADVTVTNVSGKAVPFASFYVYMLDKKGSRIGEGYIEVSNVAAGQQVRVPLTAHAIGSVASMQLQPQHVPSDEPKKIPTRIASVPSGAVFKVDGHDGGITPTTISLTQGQHTVEFSKEGFTAGSTVVDVTPGAPLAAVEFQLAGLSQDTVVLRDGSSVNGDVTAVTLTSVTLKVKGKTRSFDRNQVARVLFVERQTAKKTAAKRK